MGKKFKLSIIVVLIVAIGIFGFRTYSSYRNKQIIIKEVSTVIEENIEAVYNIPDAEEYGIRNIQYEIRDVQKE